MLTYDIDVAGLKRTLPLCHVSDDLYIAAFVIFGDVELTVHSAAELLKLAPEYDYLIAPEAKSIPLLYEMVLNGVGAALIPDSYYNPKDGISAYSLSPRIIVYQGIGLRRGYALREEEEYLIHLVMNNWGSPYYMHEYVDYYMEKRKRRIEMYEHSEV